MFNQDINMVISDKSGYEIYGDQNAFKQAIITSMIQTVKIKRCYHLCRDTEYKFILCYPISCKCEDSYKNIGYIFLNNIKNNEDINLLLTICEFTSMVIKTSNIISYIEDTILLDCKIGIFDSLTEREIEIMECISKGYSDVNISKKLLISRSTLRGHLRNIFDKLKIKSRTELSNYYYSNLIMWVKSKTYYYINEI